LQSLKSTWRKLHFACLKLLSQRLRGLLGILGFFKYYDFFAGSLAALLRVPQSSVVLQIILPVGVSFYTFASLSYTFDVYWGKMKAVRNPIDYALFIAFFPHLIAGPIIRARQFITQIWSWRPPVAIVVQSGIVLVLSGLLKKDGVRRSVRRGI
jgi:alginate O-acetyltransferase complex protein AlgI